MSIALANPSCSGQIAINDVTEQLIGGRDVLGAGNLRSAARQIVADAKLLKDELLEYLDHPAFAHLGTRALFEDKLFNQSTRLLWETASPKPMASRQR